MSVTARLRNIFVFVCFCYLPHFSAGTESQNFSVRDSNTRVAHSVLKMNLSQLALRNLSFQYEYAFHKNMSGALGLNFFIERRIPRFFVRSGNGGLSNSRWKGFALTPEFRFYPGKKIQHPAPEGFYLGLYARYASYQLSADFRGTFSNGRDYYYRLTGHYAGVTAGGIVGAQWCIGKRFNLDWWMLGAGAGAAVFSLQATDDSYTVGEAEQAEVEGDLRDALRKIPLIGLGNGISANSNSVKVAIGGLPMFSLRAFGICLGYSF